MLLKYLRIRLRLLAETSRKRNSTRSCSAMDLKKELIQRVEKKLQAELKSWIKLRPRIELQRKLNLLELLKKVKPADKAKVDSIDNSQWKKTRK